MSNDGGPSCGTCYTELVAEMEHHALVLLAGIVVIGVAAQWLAWRLRLPSILLLLLAGIICGPLLGWLKPDELFGDLLAPLVSLAVAVILFEGGLTLRLAELKHVGLAVWRMATIGAAITWLVTTAAASLVLGLDFRLASLLGAILIVTGPTVIGPLLRYVRPSGATGPALKWEGIIIDPIGALLTVLIFEAIAEPHDNEAIHAAWAVGTTIVWGGGLGWLAAFLYVQLAKRYLIADHLLNAVCLILVLASFVASNVVQHESGLLAVTVMGIVLANQKQVEVDEVLEFKENLQILLLSGLFIVLAARLQVDTLTGLLLPGLGFVAVLMVVGRPASVFVSTIGTKLSRRERAFLACMAPRGIVAAAIASVFAIELAHKGFEDAGLLLQATFITIITTVAVYGLSAPWVARKLGVAESNPQGLLLVGAHRWARGMAELLQEHGFRVLLVDSSRDHVKAARLAGLMTYNGSILAEHTLDELDLGGLGKFLALTPNDWINALAAQRFERIFGRKECYQLVPEQEESKKETHRHLQARLLFDPKATYTMLQARTSAGYQPKATHLTEEFDYQAFREHYDDSGIPMFAISKDDILRIAESEEAFDPRPGEVLISLVKDSDERKPAVEDASKQ